MYIVPNHKRHLVPRLDYKWRLPIFEIPDKVTTVIGLGAHNDVTVSGLLDTAFSFHSNHHQLAMSSQSSSVLALPQEALHHGPFTQQPPKMSTMSVTSPQNLSGGEQTEKARRLRGGCIPCPVSAVEWRLILRC
jgi:hypothetical protein